MNKNEPSPSTPDDHQFTLIGGEYWPQLFVGVFIASGIIILTSDVNTSVLFWVPPGLVVGWVLLSLIFKPGKSSPSTIDHKQLALEAEKRFLERNMKKAEIPAQTAEASVKDVSIADPTQGVVSVVAEESATVETTPAPFAEGQDVIILWGSETGNAEGLAEMTATRLKDKGLAAKAIDMGKVTAGQLVNIPQLLVITSTWGDGEPPSNAIDLWETLKNKKVDLSKVKFSVLALGDSSYPQFCECGKNFDTFLETHGATRIHSRVDCDLDYETPFETWASGVAAKLSKNLVAV